MSERSIVCLFCERDGAHEHVLIHLETGVVGVLSSVERRSLAPGAPEAVVVALDTGDRFLYAPGAFRVLTPPGATFFLGARELARDLIGRLISGVAPKARLSPDEATSLLLSALKQEIRGLAALEDAGRKVSSHR